MTDNGLPYLTALNLNRQAGWQPVIDALDSGLWHLIRDRLVREIRPSTDATWDTRVWLAQDRDDEVIL